MFQNLTGWHALIVLVVVLLIFGAAKLPALARSVGQSVRILKDESRPASSVESAGRPTTDAAAAAAATPAAGTTPIAVSVAEQPAS